MQFRIKVLSTRLWKSGRPHFQSYLVYSGRWANSESLGKFLYQEFVSPSIKWVYNSLYINGLGEELHGVMYVKR